MNVSGGRKYSMIVDLLLCGAQGCISFLVLRPPVLPTFLYILGDSYSMNLLAKFYKGVLTSDKCHVVLTACQAFSVVGIWLFFFVLRESQSNNLKFWIVGQEIWQLLIRLYEIVMGIFQFLMNRLIDQITGLLSSNEKKCQSEP